MWLLESIARINRCGVLEDVSSSFGGSSSDKYKVTILARYDRILESRDWQIYVKEAGRVYNTIGSMYARCYHQEEDKK